MTAHDDKIKALLAKVEEQKTGLGTKPRATWNTNGIFKYRDGGHLNINVVQDPQAFVEALAFLLEKENLHQQAAEKLGVSIKPFVWDGFPVTEWQADFKKRIEILKWDERKKQLEETKKKLNSLVSEEGKTAMELAGIEALLNPGATQ